MQAILAKWLKSKENKKWLHDISWQFLYKKGLLMSDYMSYVATPFFVLDKIVIQLYSRIFELRLCMLPENKYWVAKIGDKPENCNIKMAFFRKIRFEDTVRMLKKFPPLYLNPLCCSG